MRESSFADDQESEHICEARRADHFDDDARERATDRRGVERCTAARENDRAHAGQAADVVPHFRHDAGDDRVGPRDIGCEIDVLAVEEGDLFAQGLVDAFDVADLFAFVP